MKDTNKIRKHRGYTWETKVVDKFTSLGFVTTRLGSTTTSMPDVSAHNDCAKLIISIECKSTSFEYADIPLEQLERCMEWCKEWGLYEKKIVILAFKFLSKKWLSKGKYENRELKEYYKIWDWNLKPSIVKCKYNGDCSIKYGFWEPVELIEYPMNVEKKHE